MPDVTQKILCWGGSTKHLCIGYPFGPDCSNEYLQPKRQVCNAKVFLVRNSHLWHRRGIWETLKQQWRGWIALCVCGGIWIHQSTLWSQTPYHPSIKRTTGIRRRHKVRENQTAHVCTYVIKCFSEHSQ